MPFVWAAGLSSVTVLVHALGTYAAVAQFIRTWRGRKEAPGLIASVLVIVRVVAALLVLHLLEAGVWAAFFAAAGLLPDLATALYFSLTSYTTVGYGDVVLPPAWRVLGPLEAAVGILMFGWSTAVMVMAATRVYGSRLHLTSGAAGEGEHRP